jgi:hypothetical protein
MDVILWMPRWEKVTEEGWSALLDDFRKFTVPLLTEMPVQMRIASRGKNF